MAAYLELCNVSFRYLEEAQARRAAACEFRPGRGKGHCAFGGQRLREEHPGPVGGGDFSGKRRGDGVGEIRLLGRPLAEYAIPQRTKALTVLFQNPDLQFCMDTLRKELFFCLENLSVSPEEMEARVEKFARLYGWRNCWTESSPPCPGERSRRRPSAVFCFWSPGG